MFNKGPELYSGKAKTLYSSDHEGMLIVEFRDDTTAFNKVKHAQLSDKGKVNCEVNTLIMSRFENAGIPTHFERQLDETHALVKHLKMIPLEAVVRNVAAGTLCKRLGIQRGQELDPPVFEFFLKDDDLGDPAVNESHIETFKWATKKQVEQMKELSLKVNNVLKPLFLNAGLILVDYKLEFGLIGDEIFLGDEFTPDSCRLWDAETRDIFDKDRFREDLGGVVEAYQEVARRLVEAN